MVRVVAIADSESYLKWSAATLAAMPDSWQTRKRAGAQPDRAITGLPGISVPVTGGPD